MDLRYFSENGECFPKSLCFYFGAEVADKNVMVLWKKITLIINGLKSGMYTQN